MACMFCGDTFKAWRCGVCKATIGASCPECHAEKSHGEIPPQQPQRDSWTRRMEDRYDDDMLTKRKGGTHGT